ncbi:MAG TPA: hypothetical protein VF543_16690 [Pyrinomonadaceae bacterium]
MNLRRYASFLAVAILTFVIGVSAAMLFGRVNPFSRRPHSRRNCARLTALPDNKSRMTVYTVYRQDGTIVKSYEVEKSYGLERLSEDGSKEIITMPMISSEAAQPSR